MTFELPPLPYPKDALAPHLSAETLDLHHGRHHAAYVEKLNGLVAGTRYAEMPLDEILRRSDGEVFDNAAQHWNHSFFWHCMAPRGGGRPKGRLAEAMERTWGGFDGFVEAFTKEAVSHFGSGHANRRGRRGNPRGPGKRGALRRVPRARDRPAPEKEPP